MRIVFLAVVWILVATEINHIFLNSVLELKSVCTLFVPNGGQRLKWILTYFKEIFHGQNIPPAPAT